MSWFSGQLSVIDCRSDCRIPSNSICNPADGADPHEHIGVCLHRVVFAGVHAHSHSHTLTLSYSPVHSFHPLSDHTDAFNSIMEFKFYLMFLCFIFHCILPLSRGETTSMFEKGDMSHGV